MTAVACWMQRLLGRRAGGAERADWVVFVGDAARAVRLRGEAPLSVELTDDAKETSRALTLDAVDWAPGQALFHGRLDGRAFTATVAPAAEGFTIRHRAAKARVLVLTPRSAELHHKLPPRMPPDTSRRIVSPMPGLVVSLDVAVGAKVAEGQVVAVIEAMKMQNIIRAERDGVVAAVGAGAGDSVAADQVLVEFAA